MAFADLDNADALVMAEECPQCGAKPYRRCHKGDGHRAAASTHKARWRTAARRYAQQRELAAAGPAGETKERQQTRPSAAAQLDY